MSRGNFNKLRRIGIIKKIKSRQQESAHTDGRYALSKSSFNGRPEEFLDFVEEMNDTNVSDLDVSKAPSIVLAPPSSSDHLVSFRLLYGLCFAACGFV